MSINILVYYNMYIDILICVLTIININMYIYINLLPVSWMTDHHTP